MCPKIIILSQTKEQGRPKFNIIIHSECIWNMTIIPASEDENALSQSRSLSKASLQVVVFFRLREL